MDEPGYVVSAITGDGYIRVQRLPQGAPHGLFLTERTRLATDLVSFARAA